MAAFATAHQRYLTTIITMVKSQALLIQPIALGMHHTLPQLAQQVNHAINMVLLTGELYSQSVQLIVLSLMHRPGHQHVHNLTTSPCTFKKQHLIEQ